MKNRHVIFSYLLVFILFTCSLCGCSRYSDWEPWEPTDYSLEDILGMAYPESKHNYILNYDEEDCSPQALKAYNILLGYLEEVIGEDYMVTNFYYSKIDERYKGSYVIKIILTRFEDENSSAPELMLKCKEDFTKVKGDVSAFLKARAWETDLKADLAAAVPDYYMNSNYIQLDYVSIEVYPDNKENLEDYTKYYKNASLFEGSSWTNTINLFVPMETSKEELIDTMEEITPLFLKYCVTGIYVYQLTNENALEHIITEEKVGKNYYSSNNENITYLNYFKLESR